MATITKSTVEVTIGQYTYAATLDGNRVELFRDGAHAGHATWTGQTMEDFPHNLSPDAKDKLSDALQRNMSKAWRASTTSNDLENTTDPSEKVAAGDKPQDAGNQGQLGYNTGEPARQGEAEVGVGGPGLDPRTGEIGGQSISPQRRDVPGGTDVDQRAIEQANNAPIAYRR
jgi:hypothetical protein